jgi:hypothetical protein
MRESRRIISDIDRAGVVALATPGALCQLPAPAGEFLVSPTAKMIFKIKILKNVKPEED